MVRLGWATLGLNNGNKNHTFDLNCKRAKLHSRTVRKLYQAIYMISFDENILLLFLD